jgi:GH15 family glucan-1,4-alpha-glucosidase
MRLDAPAVHVPLAQNVSAVGAVEKAGWQKLEVTARRSLETNIHTFGTRHYLSAGAAQFKGLWTRDFAWSTRGLLAMGRADVVKDQLELLLSNLRPSDHLLPRTLDSTDTKFRVALATAHQLLPFLPESLGISDHLKPEFIDQYGQLAFDGNLMVVLAAKQYVDATGDTGFWAAHKTQLADALKFYDAHTKDGLLQQPAYSDWQDSVKREGASFYSNMVYQHVLELVAGDPAFPGAATKSATLREKIENTFKDPTTGLYRSMATGPQTSLDGNLLALDLGFVSPDSAAGKALFTALRASPLWTAVQGPGFTTWPSYPADQKSPIERFVGLEGYHDTLYWSWEMALAAKVAGRMGDMEDAKAIVGRLEKMASRDGAVAEVYEPKDGLPVKQTLLYHSEHPFSWGSAFVVDALQTLAPKW